MIKKCAKKIFNKMGLEIARYNPYSYIDIKQDVIDIISKAKPFTATTYERMIALIEAVRYIIKYSIPGDIVECGVWRGGSIIAIIETLKQMHVNNKDIYCYDTFEGMVKPGEEDICLINSKKAFEEYESLKIDKNSSHWYCATLDEVKRNVYSTNYSPEKIHFIKGRVEDTIPLQTPSEISLLRLDTDWYESTKHELNHLFPRLAKGGVLIIDDFGHWQGCRKAVDEYFKVNNTPIFLNRIDYSGRIAIKI